MRLQAIQSFVVTGVNIVVLLFLSLWLDNLQIQSAVGVVGISILYIFLQSAYWWLFINFFSWLPVWLYPLLTFILAGWLIFLFGNLVPGILIADFATGLQITMALTSVNAFVGSLLSLDIDEKFDSNVTRKLVARRGDPEVTSVPGFLFLEIDGLSEKIFRQALSGGFMPTLYSWLKRGSHQILGWETDFTSQTCAMQTGILFGNNDEVPAYRWWDRKNRRLILSGDPRTSAEIEKKVSRGMGLLSDGGASRGNMFSGDATESLFTFGTLLDPSRGTGPGFYLYLVSPFIIARLITRYFMEVVREWWQALMQRLRRDKYIVSARGPIYAFFRAAVVLLQDLITYVTINDVLRGLPAVYALYVSYDDVAHYAGMDSPDAFKVLREIDRHFARIERALQFAPRPYHVIVLSDHGQSTGPTFQAAYGITLEQLVNASIHGDSTVYASLNTNEFWDAVNAFLNESIHANTRTARVLNTMIRSKTAEGMVAFGPERNKNRKLREQKKIDAAQVVVLASGCAGLIYFTDASQRMSYEEIQIRYPDLILNLIQHPGIGFVLVRSEENGDLVLGKAGIYFLDSDTYEGENPLKNYGPNAAAHLRRESSFASCPDIIVNTAYDPLTGELCSFENQVSHHGGLGGPQNFPFIFHPVSLPVNGQPLVGAVQVYQLLKGWRDAVQRQMLPELSESIVTHN